MTGRPEFHVTIGDAAGHKLHGESMEAAGPMEACAKAAAGAETADVAESGERMDSGIVPPFTMDA